jgi:hypothetical protein
LSDEVTNRSELRVVKYGSELLRSWLLSSADLLGSLLWLDALLQVRWNSVEDVVYGSLDVVEGGSQGCLALFPGESHGHEFIDLSFMVGSWGLDWLGSLLLDFLLDLLLLLSLGLLLGCFRFDFVLGFGFLYDLSGTWT